MSYLIRLSTAISQMGNALIGGNPNRTISARCYLNRDKRGWRQAYKVINIVYFWQSNHCKESHNADIQFAREVLSYDAG